MMLVHRHREVMASNSVKALKFSDFPPSFSNLEPLTPNFMTWFSNNGERYLLIQLLSFLFILVQFTSLFLLEMCTPDQQEGMSSKCFWNMVTKQESESERDHRQPKFVICVCIFFGDSKFRENPCL